MKWKSDFTLFALIVICNVIIVGGRWCTQTKSEHMDHQVTVMQKCNQTYESSCSFFSWDTCTYNEVVDCPVKKNITVTRYYTVDVCCRGFKLDPINNVTCIPTSAESVKSPPDSPPKPPKPPKEWHRQSVAVAEVEKSRIVTESERESENNVGSTSSSIDGGDDDNGDESIRSPEPPNERYSPRPTTATVSGVEKDVIESEKSGTKTESDCENNVSVSLSTSTDSNGINGNEGDEGHVGYTVGGHSVDDEDNLLFGLSYGAYAGIICSLLFIFCVLVLIMLHVRKRTRKNMAKGKQAHSMEMETTQKMLNVPA